MTIPVRHIAETTITAEKAIGDRDVETELDNIESSLSFDADKPIAFIIDDNKDIQKLVGEILDADTI